MTKRIGIVADLFERTASGESKTYKRRGQVIYEIKKDNGELFLYHYGTPILIYKNDEAFNVDCYSVSDRDAINTLLSYCLDSDVYVRWGPVMGQKVTLRNETVI